MKIRCGVFSLKGVEIHFVSFNAKGKGLRGPETLRRFRAAR